MRRVNIIVASVLSLTLVLLGVFVFRESWLRAWEACKDLGLSVAYYFCELFAVEHDIVPSVKEKSEIFLLDFGFADNGGQFWEDAKSYFLLFFNAENFNGYWGAVESGMLLFARVLTIAVPALVLLIILMRMMYRRPNVRHGKDTLPLKLFRNLMRYTYVPLKRWLVSFRDFLREYRWIRSCWLFVLAAHLNLVSIAVAFLAFYFYFAVSFDVVNVFVQLYKLVADLQVLFRTVPLWVLVFAVYPLFSRWRTRLARDRLRHFEARNCGFINELPIVSMACGSMGKKKTTLITDMVLSQEVMFRQKALSILQESDMKFPYFPWVSFEDELRACMEHGTVYNLASVKAWVALKRSRFIRHGNAQWQLYGYEVGRYGGEFDDALKVNGLFDVLETYAQAYFIYVLECSLIVSNYSIRTDNALIDAGNLPLWDLDFFPRVRRETNRRSHILDFDVLRLGKKVLENNPLAGSFEFGVVAITEIGKERGNMLELKEIKKGTSEANQKNDRFNSWLKMCRHSATVDHFPFIKVFVDEQRPESWGADARELADVIHIISSGKMHLALPFYTIEEMVSEWAFGRFMRLYEDFRFRRGDNTLLVYLLKSITAWLWRRNLRIYNRFGYCVLRLEKERGTMDGKYSRKRYFLMNAKIYAGRFSTDCFSDYFNDLARHSRRGLPDYLEYAFEKATVEELKAQNSYFINSLYGGNT